ncbi:MAG: YraN family protein [Candidatus Cloacimonadaceae bacterium]
MKKLSKTELARAGENLAAEHLERKGYSTIIRNFRTKTGEIDLIVEKDQQLIFVEVKTRSYHSITSAVENIHYQKIKRISLTALQYINQNPQYSKYNTRFDAVILLYNPQEESFKITHFEDAFLPILPH